MFRWLPALLLLALPAAADELRWGLTDTVRYDLEERTDRFDLPGRLDEVSGLAFTPDGRHLATGGMNGRLHLWDTETHEIAATPLPSGDRIFCIAISADGTHLAAGDEGHRAYLFRRAPEPAALIADMLAAGRKRVEA